MGTAPSHQDQPLLFYHVNLEGRLRLDHPLRQVQAALDLSFVLPAVQGHYGRSGHVSLDPRVIIKLMVQVGQRLDFLWFVGFDLETTIPDHSVLSKARARWGAEVFERLFVRTVQQCVQAGLVDGRLLHVDSNLSTMCSLRRRKRKRQPSRTLQPQTPAACHGRPFCRRGQQPWFQTRPLARAGPPTAPRLAQLCGAKPPPPHQPSLVAAQTNRRRRDRAGQRL